MKTAGLLSPEQLETVFSNLDELITINDRFTDHLLDSLELANDQGDEVSPIICPRTRSTYSCAEIFSQKSSVLIKEA